MNNHLVGNTISYSCVEGACGSFADEIPKLSPNLDKILRLLVFWRFLVDWSLGESCILLPLRSFSFSGKYGTLSGATFTRIK